MKPLGLLPHDGFVAATEAAKLDRYKIDPRTRARNAAAFTEMKNHVLAMHRTLEVAHSFEDAAGRVVDCVPIHRQPSLKRGQKLAAPLDLRPLRRGEPPVKPTADADPESLGDPDPRRPTHDRHGNQRIAPEGTIPIRRVTVDDLVRFDTLDDYFRKHRGPRSRPPPSDASSGSDPISNHRYAYTFETMDAIGGHSVLSVYDPAIAANQAFSLAQHWYTAGGDNAQQTCEVGWQVYPAMYGHAMPVLFTYWTADNYQTTGAYNLDQPGFVQTNSAWTLGGALTPVSTPGSLPQEIELAAYLTGGNWWIYVGGLSAADALGYYPTSLYAGGPMATKAEEISYGGETVATAAPWPPMGSGQLAAAGWDNAAYQRDIFRFLPSGGTQWAELTPDEPSPGSYTVDLETAPTPWGVYFFFGGPGGSG